MNKCEWCGQHFEVNEDVIIIAKSPFEDDFYCRDCFDENRLEILNRYISVEEYTIKKDDFEPDWDLMVKDLDYFG